VIIREFFSEKDQHLNQERKNIMVSEIEGSKGAVSKMDSRTQALSEIESDAEMGALRRITVIMICFMIVFCTLGLINGGDEVMANIKSIWHGEHPPKVNSFPLVCIAVGWILHGLIQCNHNVAEKRRVSFWLMSAGCMFAAVYILALTGWILQFHYSIDSIPLPQSGTPNTFNWHQLIYSLAMACFAPAIWFERKMQKSNEN
jgi:H+/Cl- antiporter ClcA